MCENTYVNIQTGEVLDMERLASLKENAMLRHSPHLFNEWDFVKNNELRLDIYKVTKSSGKKAWWICPKCESNYESVIANRHKGVSCPYCSGQRVNLSNSLKSLCPDLAKEWHPTKNGDLTPNDITKSSNKKVWWLGECGHEWDARVSSRHSGTDCPYCANQNILKNFNDMWTTDPDLASLLANPEDGFIYTKGSKKKVDWKCPNCGDVIKNKVIIDIREQGLSCPSCSDGVSYPEKVTYHLFIQLEIEFEYQKSFEWEQSKRYDFYLPHPFNAIIEVHGGQHSIDNTFHTMGGRTLEEEQENDRLKEKLAKENGIDHYIVIDARESNIEYMKNSILNSKLSKLFNLNYINWDAIKKKSYNNFIKITCDLWNKSVKNTKFIADKMKISKYTAIKYLKIGSSIGLCTYNPVEEHLKNYRRISTIVVKVSNNKIIDEYPSISEASRVIGISWSSIQRICTGKKKNIGNYKLMYKEDYENQYGKIDE